MLLGRRRISETLREDLVKYSRLDPYTYGITLRSKLLRRMAKRGPKKILEVFSEFTDISSIFPHNSIIGLILLIAEVLLDIGHIEEYSSREFASSIGRIIEVVDRADNDYLGLSGRALAMELFPEADVFATTGGKILSEVILGARSKIEIVRVPYLSPHGKGMRLSELLENENVPSIPIRDDLRTWGIARSDFILFPIYAVTKEGLLVSDYGVTPSINIAYKLDKQIMALSSWSTVLAIHSVDALTGLPKIHNIRIFDIIDPDEIPLKLVTDKFVVEINRDKILKLSEGEIRGIKELVRVLLRSSKR